MITLTIKDKSSLYAIYMPFLENGGVFVQTTASYKLGDEVYIQLRIMDNPEPMRITGSVVWITSENMQIHRVAGVGVHFVSEDILARDTIELFLGESLNLNQPTYTM